MHNSAAPMQSSMEELRSGIRRGDLVAVKILLDDESSGARRAVNQADDEGSTALHLAIGTKQLAIANLLLRCGANPNLADGYGYAPLHLAQLVAEQLRRRRKGRMLQAAADIHDTEVERLSRHPLVRANEMNWNGGEICTESGARGRVPRRLPIRIAFVHVPQFDPTCLGSAAGPRRRLARLPEAHAEAHRGHPRRAQGTATAASRGRTARGAILYSPPSPLHPTGSSHRSTFHCARVDSLISTISMH